MTTCLPWNYSYLWREHSGDCWNEGHNRVEAIEDYTSSIELHILEQLVNNHARLQKDGRTCSTATSIGNATTCEDNRSAVTPLFLGYSEANGAVFAGMRGTPTQLEPSSCLETVLALCS